MRYISDTLIHFLGRSHTDEPGRQLNIFKEIIKNGLKCGHIEMKYGQVGKIYNLAVCFTDLPLAHCDHHTAVYGKFGIGFSKAFVKNIGGNPVHYIVDYFPLPTGSSDVIENRGLIYENATTLFKTILTLQTSLGSKDFSGLFSKDGKSIFSNEEIASFISYIRQLFSFHKPMGDLGPPRDNTDSMDEYYKEREWRVVPFKGSMMSGRAVGNENDGIFFKFERKDIRTIIAPNKEIRTQIVEWFSEHRDDKVIGDYFSDPPTIFVYDEIQALL